MQLNLVNKNGLEELLFYLPIAKQILARSSRNKHVSKCVAERCQRNILYYSDSNDHYLVYRKIQIALWKTNGVGNVLTNGLFFNLLSDV